MTSIPRWIDIDFARINDRGFLVETNHNGVTAWSVRNEPLRTNKSLEPRLYGWCGETDNRSRFARGAIRIVGTNAAGTRAQIKSLQGDDLALFLEEAGYSELQGESA
jgi:hypothetical protein